MKRLLLLLALAAPVAHAQVLTTTANNTTTIPSQVMALAPQLLAFAGSDANFAALVNGLALGTPVTLTTPLANGGSQVFTFTPGGAMSALDIAQTLEKARQALIARGVATPTAQQLGVTLTGGTLATASGTTSAAPILPGASTGSTSLGAGSATMQSPANAIQATNSAPSTNAAAGGTATTGVRNMSDSPFPRGIADTPALPVPGVTSPLPSAASTEAPRIAGPAAVSPAAVAPAVRAGDR